MEVQGESGSFRVTDMEKTILDCLDLSKYVNSYQNLLDLLRKIPLKQDKLVDYGFRMKCKIT